MVDFDADDARRDLSSTGVQSYERVREWTRARFGLAKDAAILVAELKCSVEACPPLETALAFWSADNTRYQFKLLKPVSEVMPGDLAWLIGELGDQQTDYWDCC